MHALVRWRRPALAAASLLLMLLLRFEWQTNYLSRLLSLSFTLMSTLASRGNKDALWSDILESRAASCR